jgi:hypothetical protein
MTMTSQSPKLSNHQKRVLAALVALEDAHGWRWWPRHAIGVVVGAGGFHDTIQLGTMHRLKLAGLVQTERASWPQHVAERVTCNCACGNWGLTLAGRELADSLRVKITADVERIVLSCKIFGRHFTAHDEDEPPPYYRGEQPIDGVS